MSTTVACGAVSEVIHNMSWETRARGTRYYTRSRRQQGQIVREYIGKGDEAERIAAIDCQARRQREEVRDAEGSIRRATDDEEAPIIALHAQAEMLTRGALLVAGFHRHHRQWRRRRG
jgi:hypothetical protein